MSHSICASALGPPRCYLVEAKDVHLVPWRGGGFYSDAWTPLRKRAVELESIINRSAPHLLSADESAVLRFLDGELDRRRLIVTLIPAK